jgi:hypothetical protein
VLRLEGRGRSILETSAIGHQPAGATTRVRLLATLSAVDLLVGASGPMPAVEPDRGPDIVVTLEDDFG